MLSGERRDAALNNVLAQKCFTPAALPADAGGKGGEVAAVVEFDLDANGSLTVTLVLGGEDAARRGDSPRWSFTISNDKGRLSREEVEQMVAGAQPPPLEWALISSVRLRSSEQTAMMKWHKRAPTCTCIFV